MGERDADRLRRDRRRARVRGGWVPPGPRVPGNSGGEPDLEPGPGETLDSLTGHFRIFQRRDGHRYSTDDLLCAWYAVRSVRGLGIEPRRVLDLGTGIGSVALMVAWQLPEARVVGLEAQPGSVALARRSARYDGVADRVTLLEGDLRDPGALPEGERFDLVTASPPYLPVGAGTESTRPQKAPACFTHRGDVRDYALAARRALAPGGVLALVFAAYRPTCVPEAAVAAGLSLLARREVVPRAGKAPLVALHLLGLEPRPEGPLDEPPLVVRDARSAWTREYRQLRREMGFPWQG